MPSQSRPSLTITFSPGPWRCTGLTASFGFKNLQQEELKIVNHFDQCWDSIGRVPQTSSLAMAGQFCGTQDQAHLLRTHVWHTVVYNLQPSNSNASAKRLRDKPVPTWSL